MLGCRHRSSGTLPCVSASPLNQQVCTLQFIHEASSEALDLLGGGDGEEGDLCEPLLLELPEADASDYLGVVLEDDHGLVISIEDQLDDILLGHLGQLPGEDILEVEQVLQVLVVLVVADDLEGDLVGLLLLLGRAVPGHEPQSHVLTNPRSTSPCMPTKLLGFSFYSSIILCNKCDYTRATIQ